MHVKNLVSTQCHHPVAAASCHDMTQRHIPTCANPCGKLCCDAMACHMDIRINENQRISNKHIECATIWINFVGNSFCKHVFFREGARKHPPNIKSKKNKLYANEWPLIIHKITTSISKPYKTSHTRKWSLSGSFFLCGSLGALSSAPWEKCVWRKHNKQLWLDILYFSLSFVVSCRWYAEFRWLHHWRALDWTVGKHVYCTVSKHSKLMPLRWQPWHSRRLHRGHPDKMHSILEHLCLKSSELRSCQKTSRWSNCNKVEPWLRKLGQTKINHLA